MSVTKKKPKASKNQIGVLLQPDDLNFVVRVLNRDFKTPTELQERDELPSFRDRLVAALVPMIATEPSYCVWEGGEIRQILKKPDWKGLREPSDGLRRLLEDIGELKSRISWTFGETTFLRERIKHDITGREVRSRQIIRNEAPFELGRNQRIVQLPGGKLIFYRRYIAKTNEERVYAALAESLENGEFANLRLCGSGTCTRFFLKTHGNQQYCMSCAKEAEKIRNRTRQRRHRRNIKLRTASKKIAQIEGEAYRAGRRLFEEAEQLFARRAKLTTKDKDRLVQIRHRITHWPDFSLNWNQSTAEAQKEWIRAAQMIG